MLQSAEFDKMDKRAALAKLVVWNQIEYEFHGMLGLSDFAQAWKQRHWVKIKIVPRGTIEQ